MGSGQPSQRRLTRLVASRVAIFVAVLCGILFLPAGTLAYWQAWVYLGILLVPMSFMLLYLLRNDPALLERRMRMREREPEQKLIVKLSYLVFLAVFLLPGFDRRFGWSHVPVAVVVAADLLVLLGYGLFALVLRENSYASRVIEVEQGQQVISSGPYAIVRHPMYLGTGTMYLMTPLALGSYWALFPALLLIPVLVVRIRNEEQVLADGLPGYREYMKKTRYRLVPGIW
jgi:protein-S-isoprenylcysteine O-methyltransferase Ste14